MNTFVNAGDFLDMVRRQFAYLNEQYGFSGPDQILIDEPDSDLFSEERVRITYHSPSTIVVLTRDFRAGPIPISMMIGPIADPEIARFHLETVTEFYAGRKITLDVEPYIWTAEEIEWRERFSREHPASERFAGRDRTRFVPLPITLSRQKAWEENRLFVRASALRQYCEPILRGDFTRWVDMCKHLLNQWRKNDPIYEHVGDKYVVSESYWENSNLGKYIKSKGESIS